MKKRVLALMMAIVCLLAAGCAGSGKSALAQSQEAASTIPEGFVYTGPAAEGPSSIKIVSYNLRCGDDKNGNTIRERAERLMAVLDQCDPDVIGFQEAVPEWMEILQERLGGRYQYVLKYRAKGSQEGTPIFYKKDRFSLADTGYFWLSETPDQESKGWDADYYRICSWVKLTERATGKQFVHFNSHWDFTEAPQLGSAALTIARAKEQSMPVVCTADYNMSWDAKAYQEMTAYFTDVNQQRDPQVTYQNYGGEDEKLIDYVFERGFTPVSYRVLTEKPDGKYVSDHFGLLSELTF